MGNKKPFDKDRLYKMLEDNGINSVRGLCDEDDSLCYGGKYVSRKTIERACQTGEVSNRTLSILSEALDCTPEFLMGLDVIVTNDMENTKHVVYLSDGRQAMFNAAYTGEIRSADNIGIIPFYDANDNLIAEFKSACVLGWVRL